MDRPARAPVAARSRAPRRPQCSGIAGGTFAWLPPRFPVAFESIAAWLGVVRLGRSRAAQELREARGTAPRGSRRPTLRTRYNSAPPAPIASRTPSVPIASRTPSHAVTTVPERTTPNHGAPDLTGRVAIVTGSSRRTGRVIAGKLAAAGASVVSNGRQARAEAEAVAREIEAICGAGRALAFMGDVGEPGTAESMVAACVERFGRLDILVNNASVRKLASLETITMDVWRDVLRTTLDGTLLCCRAAAPHLARGDGGTIVNIGGVSAHTGAKNAVATVTAKSGLLGLTRALAHDLGPMGITVNVVAPASMIHGEDDPQRIRTLRSFYKHENIPLGRSGTVDEIAGAVVALCGPAWRYMTGQVIHINGGVFFGN
ncbi:MAG: SDR family oxidoreductase [Burkholderiales bacterium]|nr:SDR family oxidoreductase [Burkholderiales bacterium]